MAITVLFFGQLVEITGFGELQICESTETDDLIYSNEKKETSILTAVNQTIPANQTTSINQTITLQQIFVTKPITGSEDLKEVLLSRFPGLADIVFNIAVDTVIIEEDTRLKPGSIVALLPPFSGG